MNIDLNIFDVERNLEQVGKGKILISEPFAQDNYFHRSIVLLTEHNEKGSFGFILNKPIDIKPNEILKDFPKADFNVSIGGPVNQDSVHYIHTLGDKIPQSVNICENVFWGGDFDILKVLVKQGLIHKNQLRFFIGYSGWEAKQLDEELLKNYWIVSEINSEKIMNIKKDYWKNILDSLGEKFKIWANSPQNPSMN
ncbi:MAG: YqgE/AlgH family protein [Bacteroidales bacterium]|nr:YqgE/AlgH family protein [Bacteroidales bacterium]